MKPQNRVGWLSNETSFSQTSSWRKKPETGTDNKRWEVLSRAQAWALKWDSAALAALRNQKTEKGPLPTDGTPR